MLERILILGGVILALFSVWSLVRIWQRSQLARLQSQAAFAHIVTPGKAAVIAFYTPQCAECRTRQAPALAHLNAQLGDSVQIHRLSAFEHPELVDMAGILTVPATLILDAHGTVRKLNLGFADATQLATQLSTIL